MSQAEIQELTAKLALFDEKDMSDIQNMINNKWRGYENKQKKLTSKHPFAFMNNLRGILPQNLIVSDDEFYR